MSDLTKAYYEDYWKASGPGSPREFGLPPALALLLGSVIKPGSTVLDVGCGTGDHYGGLITGKAAAHYGLDISEVAVEEARSRGILASVHNLGNTMPFEDEFFDLVVCIEVLEHLSDPFFAIGEIARVLKKGGAVLITVPNIAHISNRMRLLGGRFVAGGSALTAETPWCDPHLRFFTKLTFEKFLESAGLRILLMTGMESGFLANIPVISIILGKILGRKRLLAWSGPFDKSAKMFPTLIAGNFVAIVEK